MLFKHLLNSRVCAPGSQDKGLFLKIPTCKVDNAFYGLRIIDAQVKSSKHMARTTQNQPFRYDLGQALTIKRLTYEEIGTHIKRIL